MNTLALSTLGGLGGPLASNTLGVLVPEEVEARRPRAAGNGAYQSATAWWRRPERDRRDLETLATLATEAFNRYLN